MLTQASVGSTSGSVEYDFKHVLLRHRFSSRRPRNVRNRYSRFVLAKGCRGQDRTFRPFARPLGAVVVRDSASDRGRDVDLSIGYSIRNASLLNCHVGRNVRRRLILFNSNVYPASGALRVNNARVDRRTSPAICRLASFNVNVFPARARVCRLPNQRHSYPLQAREPLSVRDVVSVSRLPVVVNASQSTSSRVNCGRV